MSCSKNVPGRTGGKAAARNKKEIVRVRVSRNRNGREKAHGGSYHFTCGLQLFLRRGGDALPSEFAGKPLAVGGDAEKRHGIVLTANYIAKRRGVKTGMALWQARQCCRDLIFVPPRMYLYLRFSRMARNIYRDYSDKVESFGLDECWMT